jgi:hypothetical protein
MGVVHLAMARQGETGLIAGFEEITQQTTQKGWFASIPGLVRFRSFEIASQQCATELRTGF